MNRRFLVAGAAALTLLAAPAAAQAACDGASASITSISSEQAEAAMFCLINEARADAGKAGLTRKARFVGLERAQAAYSVEFGALTHIDASGRNPAQRLSDAGYNWRAVGENLVLAATPADGLQAWLNDSPAHQRILLRSRFRDGGVGVARNGTQRNAVFAFLGAARR